MTHPTHLIGYIRDENRRPVGTMVAVKMEDNSIRVGISLKNPADKLDKNVGFKIARGRAISPHFSFIRVARNSRRNSIESQRESFLRRAEHYFRHPLIIVNTAIV